MRESTSSYCSQSESVLIDGIPNEIAEIILQKLWTLDRIRLRSVSKAWNAALRQLRPPPSELPWKILSKSFDQPGTNPKQIKLLCPSNKKEYTFEYPNNGQCCCGSSKGWLFIGGAAQIGNILLWNPLTGEITDLPPLSSLQFFDNFVGAGFGLGFDFLSCFISRVHVFSTNSSGLAVAMILSFLVPDVPRRLIICRPDDPQWTAVDLDIIGIGDATVTDILFHRGKLIVYCNRQILTDFDGQRVLIGHGCHTVSVTLINGGGQVEMQIVTMVYGGGGARAQTLRYLPDSPLRRGAYRDEFLVASGEMLLLVSAVVDRPICRTYQFMAYRWIEIGGFEVHRINVCGSGSGSSPPEKLRSIGRQAVFVGGGCDAISTAVNDIDNGEFSNDFIYFTANGYKLASIGFFDYDDGVLEGVCTVHQRGLFDVRNNALFADAMLSDVRDDAEFADVMSSNFTKSNFLGWIMPAV
ncbi:uncharacterized protein LOC127241695 [Andrographis paniculata]|uniref:uncharacterized protein LOC127241695 n=1 Tax=Andrographis paniculata TaxID=175694 RepID=UPI0021E7A110|nr:uncharacterized protein LOC127241695 [Andrographis paniculata]